MSGVRMVVFPDLLLLADLLCNAWRRTVFPSRYAPLAWDASCPAFEMTACRPVPARPIGGWSLPSSRT